MSPPVRVDVGAPCLAARLANAKVSIVPRYLEQVYWWAYVHPRAVSLFEREWLVNATLFGGLYQQLVWTR